MAPGLLDISPPEGSVATAPALLSLSDYLHTNYEPDNDFVDGFIEERNLGEIEHSTFQIAIGSWFWVRR